MHDEAMLAERSHEESSAVSTRPPNAPPAAVQFCCDVCGTIPILNARWHCSVCQDFDMCEVSAQPPTTRPRVEADYRPVSSVTHT
eukprot:5005992-Pleurochrysis_carterae.AAC.1